jgi:hypothetical protein
MGENWRKSNQPVLNFPCLLIVVAQCRSVAWSMLNVSNKCIQSRPEND